MKRLVYVPRAYQLCRLLLCHVARSQQVKVANSLNQDPTLDLPNPNVAAKFIVEVQPVKEVALVAEADLAYWQDRLKGARVFPYNQQGKAAIVISATDLRSLGRRTNEFTIGLVVCERPAADSPDAFYLVQAFNSSRLFAWIERIFFATPYSPGHICVDDRMPAQIQLADRAGTIFSVQMNTTATPTVSRDELWQGKIYLPRLTADSRKAQKYFVAKLGGRTDIYPYSPKNDTLQISARNGQPVFQWLLESKLVGKEWRVRSNAVHARSKSY